MKKRFSDEYRSSVSSARLKPGFLPVSSAVSTLFPTPPFISMDYLRFASTEPGFGLLLTSIRHHENLCPNG